MWNSGNNELKKTGKNIADEVGGLHRQAESGHSDSGFLSGANISTQEVVDDSEARRQGVTESATLRRKEIADNLSEKNSDEPMRVDSGIIEVGFCETLGQMTLEPVTINYLKGKVQSEPTVESYPTNDSRSEFKGSSQQSPPPMQNPANQDASEGEIDARNFLRLYYSQDEDGDTQLHIAIVQGYHEVALSLIRMAPHPSLFDYLNQKRQSPLHLAVFTHQPTIVRHLILAGADPSLRNSDGNTALHLAAASGDFACAKALTDPLLLAERTCLDPGRRAPRIPQDLEQPNYEGETCLHSAVVAGNTEIVRLLLGVGADLEAKERLGGRTALHLAIECRKGGVTSFLLNECRPHLDAMTYGGLTPYEIASCWNSQLAKELVRLGAASPLNAMVENNEDQLTKVPLQLWSVGLRV